MNKTNELEKRLWDKSRPASEYPKDFIVIPTLDAINMMEEENKTTKEIEELRKKIEKGKISLSKYDKMAQEFEGIKLYRRFRK